MAMQDRLQQRLRARVAPVLPPGTDVRHVILCQTGPSPWFFLVTYLTFFWIHYRVVAVTDDAIYVLRASKLTARPKEVITTLPRQTRLGPVSGLWGKTELMGERHWVHKRFHNEIAAIDAAAGARRAVPPA